MTRRGGVWVLAFAASVACLGAYVLVRSDGGAVVVGESAAPRSPARRGEEGNPVGRLRRTPAEDAPRATSVGVAAADSSGGGVESGGARVHDAGPQPAVSGSGDADGHDFHMVRIKPVVPARPTPDVYGLSSPEAQAAVVRPRGVYLDNMSREDTTSLAEGSSPAMFESDYVIGNAHTAADPLPGVPALSAR